MRATGWRPFRLLIVVEVFRHGGPFPCVTVAMYCTMTLMDLQRPHQVVLMGSFSRDLGGARC